MTAGLKELRAAVMASEHRIRDAANAELDQLRAAFPDVIIDSISVDLTYIETIGRPTESRAIAANIFARLL